MKTLNDLEKIYSTTIDIKEREKGEKGEKKEYYKLFADLSSEEWGKIFNTFMELTNATTLGENISVKKNKIKAYCDENKYDFLTALREIYFYIRGSYSCRWFNAETKERGRDYFDKEKLRVHKEFFPEIFIYNDTPESNRSMVEEEEQDIYYTMINILKERKENPEEYVNNALQKVRLKADSLSFFEKEFHIKASLIENNTKQEEKQFSTKNTLDEKKNPYKCNYNEIAEKLKPFISGGTESVYRSIIEEKLLLKDAQNLRMIKPNKANIARFALCFGISISQINKIFEENIKTNNRPDEYVNEFYTVLKSINPDFSPPNKKI